MHLRQYKWHSRARSYDRCGSAGVHLACKGCGDGTVVPYRCACRTCLHAQRVAAAKVNARLLPRLLLFDRMMADQPWDGDGRLARRSWRLVTLTRPVSRIHDKNWELAALQTAVREVNAATAKFWRLTPWGRQVKRLSAAGRMRKVARQDTTAVVTLEIGAGGMVHSHLLIYGEYCSQADVAAAWERALGRQAIVDVRTVDTIENGLREVVKYLAKGFDGERLAPLRAARVEVAMRQVRRCRIIGRLRTVKVREDDAATVDLTVEDAMQVERIGCLGCGLVGEFKWLAIVPPSLVTDSGGFGYVNRRPPLPQFGADADWLAWHPHPLREDGAPLRA